MRERVDIGRKTREYDAANQEAAAIVLANPERYAGGLLMWAEAIQRKAAPILWTVPAVPHPSNDLLARVRRG